MSVKLNRWNIKVIVLAFFSLLLDHKIAPSLYVPPPLYCPPWKVFIKNISVSSACSQLLWGEKKKMHKYMTGVPFFPVLLLQHCPSSPSDSQPQTAPGCHTFMLPTEEVSHSHLCPQPLYYLKCFLKCGWTFTTSHGLNRRWMGTPARNNAKSWPNTLFPQSYSDVHALTISRVLASASHMWLAISLSTEPDLSQFSSQGTG